MASAIDATKPAAGNATTQSVRENFASAKSEIEALQAIAGLQRSANLLTVGSMGQYATIQDALDYVATQPAFVALPLATAGTVSSWQQHSSFIQLSAMPTQAINAFNVSKTWLKLAGDTFYYPFTSAIGLLSAAGPEKGIQTAMRRKDTTANAGDLTWWQENTYTLLLLDPIYAAATPQTYICDLKSNVNLNFVSLHGSIISGLWTSTALAAKSGRIRFSNVILTNGAAAELGPIGAGSGNTVALEFINGSQINGRWADLLSPAVPIGSLLVQNSNVMQNPTTTEGHILNVQAQGDIVFINSGWTINQNSDVGSYASPNAWLVDRLSCRNLMMHNVVGRLVDEKGSMERVAFVGPQGATVSPPTTGHAILSNLTLVSMNALGVNTPGAVPAKLSIVEIGTNSSQPSFVIDDCKIIAPFGTVEKKLIRAASNPVIPITVQHGAGNHGLTMDSQANITYTQL